MDKIHLRASQNNIANLIDELRKIKGFDNDWVESNKSIPIDREELGQVELIDIILHIPAAIIGHAIYDNIKNIIIHYKNSHKVKVVKEEHNDE